MRRVLFAALVAGFTLPSLAAAQSWRTVTMSRQLEGNDEVRVSVEYGVGHFTVRSLDEGLLYRMRLRYDEELFEPVAVYREGRLRLGIESIGRGFSFGGRRQSGTLELELARGVPMDLDLEFGAVRADVDLGGLSLTDLDLSTGASESSIDISEPNPARMRTARFEVGAAEFTVRHLGNLHADRIEIDAGVGSLTLWFDGLWQQNGHVAINLGVGVLELRVPEGLGLRLTKKSFLTALDSEGLVKRGDVYESLDWDEANRRVTIDLDAAFGSVKVVWLR